MIKMDYFKKNVKKNNLKRHFFKYRRNYLTEFDLFTYCINNVHAMCKDYYYF